MKKVVLGTKAEKSLRNLYSTNRHQHDILINDISYLKSQRPDVTQVKKIGENSYRYRSGRWRILFSVDPATLYIWIIEIEKDTTKDYHQRAKYVEAIKKFYNI